MENKNHEKFQKALKFLKKWNLPINFHNIVDFIFGVDSNFPECCVYFFIRFYKFPDCKDYYSLTINSSPAPGYVRCPSCILHNKRVKVNKCICRWSNMKWVEEMLGNYMCEEILLK